MNDQSLNQNDKPVKPCIRCGAVDRYKSGRCRPCISEKNKKWRQNNIEYHRKRNQKWREENNERNYQNTKKWKENNPEYFKNYTADWRRRNPNAHRQNEHNRRAKIKSGGILSKDIINILLVRQKNKCACCGKKLDGKYHLDHIIPLALGGTNTDDNVQLLLPKCNLRKGAKHPMDYMREQGRLL